MMADQIFGVKREKEVILGKSLYHVEGSYGFVGDYKKQAESLMPVGFLFEFIKQCGLLEDYAVLLGFEDIFSRLSKIYEIDLAYKVKGYVATLKRDIALLNRVLEILREKYTSEAYAFHDCHYFMDTPHAMFAIDPDQVEPDKERLKVVYDDFEKELGGEF
jgi:hypothetical protein